MITGASDTSAPLALFIITTLSNVSGMVVTPFWL